MDRRHLIALALAIATLSLVVARLATGAADDLLPRGAGFSHAAKGGEHHRLFRFDAIYYRDIATTGYRYDGDPHSSPNIVFTPLFPLSARLLAAVPGVTIEAAGFAVAHLSFLLGCALLAVFLEAAFDRTTAVVALLGLGFSAGSFSFHAYYSESTMLLWLALALWLAHGKRHGWLALVVAILGASRSTAGPFCLCFAALIAYHARDDRRLWPAVPLCFAGLVAYLLTLWAYFGNPFVLLPEIQQASWGKYHHRISITELLTLQHLWTYWGEALSRGSLYLDPRGANLVWTTLALVSVIYGLARRRTRLFTVPFAGYWLLVYYANAGSVYLISTHRFFVLMLPIYVMLADLHRAIAARSRPLVAHSSIAALFLLSFGQYVAWLVRFTQGYWYYF